MKKKGENKRAFVYSIFTRYFILLASSLGNLWIFYFLMTPLTVYASYFFLNFIFPSTLVGNTILITDFHTPIEIVEACVAGAAYFLLFIFNLSVPNIKISKRVKMILFSFSALFLINLIRIVALSVLFVSNYDIFDITHKITWYAGSVIFVVAIWFLEVKVFEIKDIPFYSDIKSILKYIKY